MSVALATSVPEYEDIKIDRKEEFNLDQNVCYGVLPVSKGPKFGHLKKSGIVLVVVLSLVLIISVTALAVAAFAESNEVKKELNDLQKELMQMMREDISEDKTNASNDSPEGRSDLIHNLVSDLQTLNIFDSCAAIMNLTLPFTSGMYWVKSSNGSAVQVYCNMELSCNGTTGGWRRVAYLNTSDGNPVHCPGNLKVRSNPPSCSHILETRRRCSSVNYRNHGNLYSQICGRIHGLRTVFQGYYYGDNYVCNLERSYVNGVSLSYGTNPRNHIWTFATSLAESARNRCVVCAGEIPAFIGSALSCEFFSTCSQDTACNSYLLWSGGQHQNIGDGTFYRELSQPTTDDIEMRVCRKRPQIELGRKDFLLTFVDIYVR